MRDPENSKLTLIAADQSGCRGTETSWQCNWDKLLSRQFILWTFNSITLDGEHFHSASFPWFSQGAKKKLIQTEQAGNTSIISHVEIGGVYMFWAQLRMRKTDWNEVMVKNENMYFKHECIRLLRAYCKYHEVIRVKYTNIFVKANKQFRTVLLLPFRYRFQLQTVSSTLRVTKVHPHFLWWRYCPRSLLST